MVIQPEVDPGCAAGISQSASRSAKLTCIKHLPLSVGTNSPRIELLSPIGAGGMGEMVEPAKMDGGAIASEGWRLREYSLMNREGSWSSG